MRDQVADDGRGDDDRAAHRGRAALGQVGAGAVVADQLAVTTRAEQPDRERRAEQRQQQRGERGNEDVSHALARLTEETPSAGVLLNAPATSHTRSAFDAFTSTASSARTSSRRIAMASSACSTTRARPLQPEVARAPEARPAASA